MATEWNFDYTGAEQSVTLKPGKYKIECWGACGGRAGGTGVTNTKGGYTSGEITLSESVVLYIYVGQSGFERTSSTSNFNWTGFNGGGKGNFKTDSSNKWIYAGGGATDVRLVNGAWDNEQSLLSRIIVAGGGGGYHSTYFYKWGVGGGFIGEDGIGGIEGFLSSGAGSQYQGGTTYAGGVYNGSFGKGGGDFEYGVGGGGGWFGGAGNQSLGIGGGGSGYVLTKDSYKPKGYTPTSKYYFDKAESIAGGNSETLDGRAKITLLQALPFLNISSYNSTTATFKADHTDPTLLTKIEYFIDDVLKETITTDLTLEKTINYTLEDNALHILKIVVTDSANATAEKVLSISKNIMPLGENVNLNDISTKLIEVNAGFKTGKTSIINTLALKNIEASLNNTLVELSEKIKAGFDSGDASVQELQNRITELTNQLSQRVRYATGTYTIPDGSKNALIVPTNLTFVPKTIAVKIISAKDGSNPPKRISAYPCMTNANQNLRYDNGSYARVIGSASIRDVTAESFKIELGKSDFNAGVEFPFTFYNSTFRWHALDIELLND
ncbi:glycine rich protein [Clostridioides difficile]|nr:glycine rich protein [Clostridioides difficile]